MSFIVYADSNIFRYLASGELELTTVGDVKLAYSTVHFDEVFRGSNTGVLEGIEFVKAIPMMSNENEKHNAEWLGVCFAYEDPYESYKKFESEMGQATVNVEDGLYELLIRLMGADNLEELQKLPDKLVDLAKELSNQDFDGSLRHTAEDTADQLEKHLAGPFGEAHSLDKTRNAFGFAKGATSKVKDTDSPIDAIWAHMKDRIPAVTQDQFFGFAPRTGVNQEITHSDGIAVCHLILNMVGFSPDKGLSKRDKIKNIISDGQHLALASMCSAFLTTDTRLYKKASAIFKYRDIQTKLIYAAYKPENMSALIVEPGSIKQFKRETKKVA